MLDSVKPINFKIEKKLPRGRGGRAALLETAHGSIETPSFVAVGTKASVKSLSPEQVKDLGAQVVLANTYHLYLQPGEEIIKQAGGLHNFMNWQGPIMTDSGGFQVFSLGSGFEKKIGKIRETGNINSPKIYSNILQNTGIDFYADAGTGISLVKIDDDGVMFQSAIDGSSHRFTPERSMEIQHCLGADIIFAFDECVSPEAPYEYQKEALARTHGWAERSLQKHQKLFSNSRQLDNKKGQALFGVVQGGKFEDLRRESAKKIGAMDFEGFGIGGSFEKKDINTAVGWVNGILPEDKPRHLLGIGDPTDLFLAVEEGCDLFDCVAPTRIARHGTLYSPNGFVHITGAKFRSDFSPLVEGCPCYTCAHFTKAYLGHLFRAKEFLAYTLASIHNLYFIVNLLKNMRRSILDGTFESEKENFFRNYYGLRSL